VSRYFNDLDTTLGALRGWEKLDSSLHDALGADENDEGVDDDAATVFGHVADGVTDMGLAIEQDDPANPRLLG
jgi:hypothetical protein